MVLNITGMGAFFKNFQGAQEGGVLAKIFTKSPKIFFSLRVLSAGPYIVKKFGLLHLSTKFHQNLCSNSKDMAFFRLGMVPKISTFHLTVHSTHVSLADEP